MKYIISILVLILIIFGGILFFAKNDKRENVIRIGVIVPLTGEQAFVGEGIRDAIVLAENELGDNTKYDYEVIFEDSQMSPKLAALAAEKLINVDKVQVIISAYANLGNVISPIAEENKVVHVGIAFDPEIAKGDFNFIHWTPPKEVSSMFVSELQKRGISRIGIFKLNHQGTLSIYNALKNSLTGTNIKIVDDQTFQAGERDFKSLIIKAEKSNPEIYVLLTLPPEIEILTGQIKNFGINKPISTVLYFELAPRREIFNGQWYVGAASPIEDFVSKYKNFSNRDIVPGVPNAYDIFNIVVSVGERSQSKNVPSSIDIRNGLSEIKNFSGALGNLNVGKDGIIWSKAEVKKIENGKPIKVY